jgi:hypothetical protein
MADYSIPDRFAVAFSLAGEQRELVRAIATEVRDRLGGTGVFLDEWFEHYLAGNDADLKLQDIYGDGCDLVVVCVSANYNDKPWTQTEHAIIRARYMNRRHTQDGLQILPLRVGDGEVAGIPTNAIVPDARGLGVPGAADLILKRLGLIRDSAGVPVAGDAWIASEVLMNWPIADHLGLAESADRLLKPDSTLRILLVQGGTDSGKTLVSKTLDNLVGTTTDIRCGRLDLKGTAGLGIAVEAFARSLGTPVPAPMELSGALGAILTQIAATPRPTLLIIDTYEMAGAASHWLESVLLEAVARASWLRVMILGQRVPEMRGSRWSAYTEVIAELPRPTPDDWIRYATTLGTEGTIDRSFLSSLHEYVDGNPSLIAGVILSKSTSV